MEKQYYKVEMRIGRIFQEVSENDVLAYPLYHSDGYIILENEKFEGFFTGDYVSGEYKGNELFLEMLYTDQKFISEPLDNKYTKVIDISEKTFYMSFSLQNIKKFLPGEEYYFVCCENNDIIAQFSLIYKEDDDAEKKEIERELEVVKKANYI